MITNLAEYYLKQEEPNQSCLLALRRIILEQDPAVTETRKWNMPCFCYQKKMFCFLRVDKLTQWPYLLLVEGKHLLHPELEQDERSRMKIFKVDPHLDLPVNRIRVVLSDALDLYRKGWIQ